MNDIDARIQEINSQIAALAAEQRELLTMRLQTHAISAPMMQDRWISTKTAMKIAGVDSPQTIYRWADDLNLLDSKRDSKRRVFSEQGVRAITQLRSKGRLRRIRGEETSFTANLAD